jgi:hypothetical protein
MPRGQRKSKIKPLKGGAKFIREPVNELIDDDDDHDQRICDLEGDIDALKGEPLTVIAVQNRVGVYLEIRAKNKGPI